MSLYVCVEGIKGSGKSSVVAHLSEELRRRGVRYTNVHPTRPVPGWRLGEQAFARAANLLPDVWLERIYAARSEFHWRQRCKRADLVLGDRSVLTSYATRFDPMHPHASLDRVDRLEKSIPLPDHVVFLDVDVNVALERIRRRARHGYGHRDQCRERLTAVRRAYARLAQDAAELGLESVHWHVIDAGRPLASVVRDATEVVLSLAERQPARGRGTEVPGGVATASPRRLRLTAAVQRDIAPAGLAASGR